MARNPRRVGIGATIIITLVILAMIAGRIVWGVASLVVYTTAGNAFTWQVFMAGAFLNAIPGIIAQIILVPILVMLLTRESRSRINP